MKQSHLNHERRKMPRVHADRELRVALVAPPMELTLIELGLGGFSVRSPKALPPETTQMFRFEGVDGSVAQLTVLIRRCDGARGPGYVIGCEFANPTHPAVGRAVGRLMDQITAALSFS
jgi:hypothetical protein